MNYAETLPLADKEVVLTFDDGPLPPCSDRSSTSWPPNACKATYFIGRPRWRTAYPAWCGASTAKATPSAPTA